MGILILVGCNIPQPTGMMPTTSINPSLDASSTSSSTHSIPMNTSLPPTATGSLTPTSILSTSTPSMVPTAEEISITDTLVQLEGLPIDQFYEASFRFIQLRNPDKLITDGLADQYSVPNDSFSNISDAFQRKTQLLELGILELLHKYDREALSPEQRLSYDIYEWVLDDKVRGHAFMYYDYPVNPLTIWGKQNWLIDFMVSYQPIHDIKDAKDYVARLSKINVWVDQLIESLKFREQAGIIPPRYILQSAIDQVDGHLHRRGVESFHIESIELYSSFKEKLESTEEISDQEKDQLLENARVEIENGFIPAYLALEDYLIKLKSKAGNVSGYHQFPDGQEYYAYIFRQQTGSELTPNQAHDLGISEVTRLQEEMLKVAGETGYPQGITLADLQQQLATDSEVIVGDSLLTEYKRLISEAEQASRSYFDHLPSQDLMIAVEPFGSGIGYYLPPPFDTSSPGRFFTNIDNPIPAHLIPTYIFHETVPGHHLQGALARELDLPMFRKTLELNGYLEGWAVYAEALAWEMGLYEDNPRGNLGRLSLELARAARLVIDTGIHTLGWTRQDAADYYQEATGIPASPEAMDRYVILPGQGCGYTIGMREILDLRRRAEDKLGDEFDIIAFHEVILGSGNLPLQILREVVEEWIITATR